MMAQYILVERGYKAGNKSINKYICIRKLRNGLKHHEYNIFATRIIPTHNQTDKVECYEE